MRKKETKSVVKQVIVTFISLFVSALVLMMASSLFRVFYVESLWVALLTAGVITLLNYALKPLLIYLTLPITLSSLGILYPIVNVIILKLASWIMGPVFIVDGWFSAFFIAIFISLMNILLQNMIVKPIMRG